MIGPSHALSGAAMWLAAALPVSAAVDTPLSPASLAASTARGWRRYPDSSAAAQTAADRHLYDVADVDARHVQRDPTPGKRATQATERALSARGAGVLAHQAGASLCARESSPHARTPATPSSAP